MPFARRELAHASLAFLIEPPGEAPRTYYLRVESTGSIQVPLTLVRHDAFAAHLETDRLVLGLFHGMLLILTAMGLLLYGLMRDRLFLLFEGFIGGYTLVQATLSGLAFQRVWPEATAWASRAGPVLVAVTGLFAAAFIRDFLESRTRLPRLDRLFTGLNAVAGVVALASRGAEVPPCRPISITGPSYWREPHGNYVAYEREGLLPTAARLGLLSNNPHDQGDHENDEKDEEQNLRNLCRTGGNAAKTEDRRNDRGNKEYCCPLQHADLLARPRWPRTDWRRPKELPSFNCAYPNR